MTSFTYTKTGPFNNNSAPGISASFVNNVENELAALNNAATDTNITSDTNGVFAARALNVSPVAVSVSGTVSGFATAVMYFTGTIKRVLVWFQGYKSASAQSLTLPVAFTGTSLWTVTELQGGKIEALASGSAQTFSIQTAIAVGGGSQTAQAFINSWSTGLCRSAFDTVRVTVTGTTATSAVVTIEGT